MPRIDYAKQVEDYRALFPVADIVRGWFRAQCRENPFGHFFLYFKPSAGAVPGALAIAEDCPEGFKLAAPERVSPAWTEERAVRFVWDTWRSLPVLPTEERPGRELSAAMERRLLRKHLTGDFGAGNWATVQALLAKGYLAEDSGRNLCVTEKGKAYCDAHHLDIKL